MCVGFLSCRGRFVIRFSRVRYHIAIVLVSVFLMVPRWRPSAEGPTQTTAVMRARPFFRIDLGSRGRCIEPASRWLPGPSVFGEVADSSEIRMSYHTGSGRLPI